MRRVLFVCCISILVAVAHAQETATLRLDLQGRLLRLDPAGEFVAVFADGLEDLRRGESLMGWALALDPGPSLAASSDCGWFFERLGEDREELLAGLDRLPSPAAPHAQRARFAMRVAALEGLGGAVAESAFEELEGSDDRSIRLAATEALARQRGEPSARGLEENAFVALVRECPSLPHAVAVVEHPRLPRPDALRRTLRRIDAARAGLSDDPVRALAELDRAAFYGYEVERRFGPARIDATVILVWLSGRTGRGALRASMLGEFDLDSIEQGLVADGVEHEREGDLLRLEIDGAWTLRVQPDRCTLDDEVMALTPLGGTLLGDRDLERVQASLADCADHPIRAAYLHIPAGAFGPGLQFGNLLPFSIGLTPGWTDQSPCRADLHFAREAAATVVEGQLRSLVRALDPLVDDDVLPPSVLDQAERVEIVRDGARLRLTVPFQEPDDELVDALAALRGG